MSKVIRLALVVALTFSLPAVTACDNDSTGPTQAVYVSGTGVIWFDYYGDLDTGTFHIGTNDSTTDFLYGDEPAGIQMQNDAAAVSLGDVDYDGVTWEQVSTATMGSLVAQSSLHVGLVVAYKTSAVRYGKFRITGHDSTLESWQITFLTWE